jgi:hypothetical protein
MGCTNELAICPCNFPQLVLDVFFGRDVVGVVKVRLLADALVPTKITLFQILEFQHVWMFGFSSPAREFATRLHLQSAMMKVIIISFIVSFEQHL